MKNRKKTEEIGSIEINKLICDCSDLRKIEEAAKKSNMKGEGHERNRKWQIAEMERKFAMNEDEIW